MTDASIIDKIRKLLELAANEGATEAEASSALEKANALMLKHGIDKDKVRQEDDDTVKVDAGKPFTDFKTKWHEILATSVAQLYGGTTLWASRGRVFMFVGREEVREASEITFLHIAAQIERWYKFGLPRGMTKTDRAKWRREFKQAAALRVKYRINEIIRDLEQNNDKAMKATGSTALVVLTHRQKLEEELHAWEEQVGVRRTKVRVPSVKGSEAAAAGLEAGNRVKINQELS